MNDTLKLIRERLIQAFSPESLEVIDESEAHKGHAGYQAGGRHFAIIISAQLLLNLSRVAAHQKIYALFNDLMPHRIHALRIKIKK